MSSTHDTHDTYSTLAAVLLLALAALGCARLGEAPRVRDGALDLSSWSFESQGMVTLEGEWRLCWGALVAPDSGECPRGWESFPVPRLWSDSGVSSPIGGKGIASYRVRIELPPNSTGLTLHAGSPMTAYRLWINGQPRGGVGTVGTRAADTVPKLENRQFPLPRDAQQLELLVHVANFDFRGGGLRRTWLLGRDEQIASRNSYELLLYAFFVSASVVIGMVFLVQFAFRPSEKARGWFGLFAVLVGLRILPGSASDLYQLLMGWASFGLLLRLEYLNTALLIFVAGGYFRAKIPDVMPPRLTLVLQLSALALVPIHLFAPLDMVLATIPVILALPPLVLGLALVSYGRAYRRGLAGAGPTLAAGLVFSVGILHDVLRTQTGLGAPIELFPYFVVAWMAAEAQALLRSFARTFAIAEKLSDELQESNFELQETEEAVVRFVPFDFLRVLGKQSIRDVRPGDHASAEMTVMSCDFHVVEGGIPADDFARLNELFGRVEPLIRTRGGFLSQQLGDRVVALFPGAPDAAVAAAVEIQRAARELDRSARAAWTADESARVRIGIATGPVLLGTVGGADSLSSVAVGAAVDCARALRELARTCHAGTLISTATRDGMRESAGYLLREIPSTLVPGAADLGPVFEVHEAPDTPDSRESSESASAAG